jgi:uncharacterized protein (TIGR00297 family)
VDQPRLAWQSKFILLLVLPAAGTNLVLESAWWIENRPLAALWTLALSALLGLVAWKMRSATPYAALAGALLTASLMFSTATVPYEPWRTALMPVLTVLILTSISTRLGRRRKEQLGTAEARKGRDASQVAANLGAATVLSFSVVQSWQIDQPWLHLAGQASSAVFVAGLACLCEAAADTVSSELGQILNGRPRMITTLRIAAPGTDGAVSLGGTLAGIVAAAIVALVGAAALHGDWLFLGLSWAAGVFGLVFDSLLGATLERMGWLNNDAVNFLSTVSAAGFALLALSAVPAVHPAAISH